MRKREALILPAIVTGAAVIWILFNMFVITYAATHRPKPGPHLIPPARFSYLPRGAALECQTKGTGCAAYLTHLMNLARRADGSAPLTLDWTMYPRTATCEGALGHAVVMAATGYLWHQNALYPKDSFPNDICVFSYSKAQNAGYAGGSRYDASTQDFNQMMSEPHDRVTCATQDNHACNILSPTYTKVGIAVYTTGGFTWFVEDFIS